MIVMTVVLLTFALFAAAMLLMAAGLLAGKALRGSCGGVDCSCANAATCERRRPGTEEPPRITGRLGDS